MAELIGDDWGSSDRNDWESMPARNDQDQPSGDAWGFTPGLSYEDRIRTVLFEAGSRRMEAQTELFSASMRRLPASKRTVRMRSS